MTTWTINSALSLQRAIGDIRDLYASHRYLKVSAKTGVARSGAQNNISHRWYAQLAMELREDDALGWKCYCKLHHGVPILRTEVPAFKEFYDTAILGLGYEDQLKTMRFVPVTSIMSKTQLTKYLESVRDDFYATGTRLEFDEDRAA